MDDKMIIKTTTDDCPCKKCWHGWRVASKGCVNWMCVKYPNGKPDEVLYDNQPCEFFEEL